MAPASQGFWVETFSLQGHCPHPSNHARLVRILLSFFNLSIQEYWQAIEIVSGPTDTILIAPVIATGSRVIDFADAPATGFLSVYRQVYLSTPGRSFPEFNNGEQTFGSPGSQCAHLDSSEGHVSQKVGSSVARRHFCLIHYDSCSCNRLVFIGIKLSVAISVDKNNTGYRTLG